MKFNTIFVITFFIAIGCKTNENIKSSSLAKEKGDNYLTIQLIDNSSADYDSLDLTYLCISEQNGNSCLLDFKEGTIYVASEGVKISLPPGKFDGSLRLRGGIWENIKTNISFDLSGISLTSGVECKSEEVAAGYTVYQNIVCPPISISKNKNPILKIEISPLYKSYLEASILLFIFFRNPAQANLRFLKVSLIQG
ncbi:hypothetical protein V6Z05_00425 [Leptospira venezuelensis]|uniref:hypothetical protein n=1 Tax=Leptospira venezuelensis TaxID=1958811 RepID=UPI000A3C4A05|nr:hypothetical protein [Leptospira venezuelensis]